MEYSCIKNGLIENIIVCEQDILEQLSLPYDYFVERESWHNIGINIEEFNSKLYNIKLTSTSYNVNANGTDVIQIKATIYNKSGEQQELNIPITFELNGEKIVITSVDGVSILEFSTDVIGTYEIKALNDDSYGDSIKVVASNDKI
jgi:hypothetical protein